MSLDDFKDYLPKYLSEESTKKLLTSLNQFPENIDQRLFTNYLENEKLIFQGDGVCELPYYDYLSGTKKDIKGIIMSNTCDIDLNNKRFQETNISFAPILSLKNYELIISKKSNKTPKQIKDRIKDIKSQKITNIFYLPKKHKDSEEYIVMFDRVTSIPNKTIDRNKLDKKRIFTLSDYGFYLFIFKLSVHFNRFQDKVERKSLI